MNNLDDWLSSLGLNTENEEVVPDEETPNLPVQEIMPAEETPQSLTQNDFDDILSDLGFNEIPEAEVVTEEEEGEEEENTEEMMEEETESAPLSEEEEQEAILQISNEIATLNQMLTTTVSEASASGEPSTPIAHPLITPNSPTLLIDDSTSRFSGASWYEEIQKQTIILAGLGGIGSWLSLQLARLHPEALFLYDDDEVEMANMSGQLYSLHSIGQAKVNAMATILNSFSSASHIYAIGERFTESTQACDIMMCGFDNMIARRVFFEVWKTYVLRKPYEERKKCLYLDGRLSIDTLQVLCIKGDDDYNMERYMDDYLFHDEDADETVCSMKQTTFLACMIGSIMTNLFVNFVANQLQPVIPYDLPFFTEYDSQNMIFRTEN